MALADNVNALATRVAGYLKASVLPRLLPQGGTATQVLKKTSANDYAAGWGAVDWSEVANKPGTFAPSAHTHPWGEVTGKPATFAPSAHGHSQSEISGLTTADRPTFAGVTFAGDFQDFFTLKNNATTTNTTMWTWRVENRDWRLWMYGSDAVGRTAMQANISTGVVSFPSGLSGSLSGNASTATKLAAARTISATGDASWSATFDGSANATASLTLANSGVAAGSYGSATVVPVVSVDAKGRVTGVTNTAIAFPADAVSSVAGRTGAVSLAQADIAGLTTGSAPTFAGASLTGALGFGAATRQMVNLWQTGYGIGVQTNTTYVRTGTEFAVHAGGSHSDTQGDAGTGGTNLMRVNASLFTYKGQSIWHTGNFNPSTKADLAGSSFTGAIYAPSASFGARPSWAGVTPWDTGNFDPNSKHPVNGMISQDATGGEKHPWEIKRTSAGAITYQYVLGTGIGVYDTALGSIWSYDIASNNFDVKGGNATLRALNTKLAIQGETTLKGGRVVTDVAGDTLRIYEDGTPFRGISVNLTGCTSQSSLWHTGNFNPDGKASLGANVNFNRIVVSENGTGTSITVGDDATMGDVNIANAIGVRGQSNAAQGFFAFGTSNAKFGYDGGNWIMNGGGNLFIQPGAGGNYQVWHQGNFDPGSKANLGGADFTGTVGTYGGMSVHRTADRGGLYMRGGDGTASGYIDFYRKGDVVRDGYIGYSNGTTINLSAEIGYFNFVGNAPRVSGNPIWHSGNFDPNGKASLNTNVSFGDITAAGNVSVAGNLTLPQNGGSNYFFRGQGDGAAWTNYNTGLRLHWGMGIQAYDGVTRLMIDARAGDIKLMGTLYANQDKPVWHSGNFDPNSKPSTGSVARFQGVGLGNGNPYVYTDNNQNIVFRAWTGSDWRYSSMNADGGWSFNNAISATTVNATGDVITTQRVVVGQGQTSSTILMKDSDEGDRSVHNNSGQIGFLNSSGGWAAFVRDDGSFWTSQFGDLNNRIENRTWDRKNEAVSEIRGANNKFTGSMQEIAANYPTLRLHYPNVKWWDVHTREDARLHFWGNGDDSPAMSIGPSGDISTRQFGDLNNRIENRARDWAVQEGNRGRDEANNASLPRWANGRVEINTVPVINREWPNFELLWGGILRHQTRLTNGGELQFVNGDNGDVFQAFRTDGSIWTKQVGDLYPHIENRAAAYANGRQANIPVYAANSVRRIDVNGQAFMCGTSVVTFTSDGIAWIAFPWWFASTVDSVVCSNGDAGVGNYCVHARDPRQNGFNAHGFYPNGTAASNVTMRVNWIAVGPV